MLEIEMDLLDSVDLKEKQKINELERKIKLEKTRLDKKLTRQKILLGSFLIDAIEKNQVVGLKEYVAENLPNYLTRDNDKKLLASLIDKLGGTIVTDSEIQASNDVEQTQYNEQYN